MQHYKEKKGLWILPWKYPESFLIALALLLASLGLELVTGKKAPVISWPVNIIIFIILILISIVLFAASKKNPIFKWFYSVQASISAVILFVVPSLLMALVPQIKTDSLSFLFDITSSWTYFTSVGFFLIILGTVTVKRLSKFSKKDIGFILNHLGLWLCITTAHIGAGDIEKLIMVLNEGETVWYGYDERNKSKKLNFAVKLRNFSIEEYPSKIAIVNSISGEIIKLSNKPLIIDADETTTFKYKKAEYKILKQLMNSAPVLNRFEPIWEVGAVQSLQIVQSLKNSLDTFWVSGPGIKYPRKIFQADSNTIMLLLEPEPKRFLSEITVYEKSGCIYDTIIEVNKPIVISDWKIYQTGYDDTMGKWSTLSNLELVKDPWLPFVYTGFLMMITGTLYLIWTGKRKEEWQCGKISIFLRSPL